MAVEAGSRNSSRSVPGARRATDVLPLNLGLLAGGVRAAAELTRLAMPLWLLAILVGGTLYRMLAWVMADIDLFSDEAYYWSWAQQLDLGYYSKPPMVAWIVAVTTGVLGDHELAVKAGAIVLLPFTAWLLFRFAASEFDRRTAVMATLLFFSLPGVAMLNVIITTDVPLLMFWTLTLMLWAAAIHQPQRRERWLLLGLSAGFGLLSKYTMGLFAVAAAVQLLVDPRLRVLWRHPNLYLGAAVAALVFAPNVLWNLSQDWPTLRHTAQISQLERGANWYPAEGLSFLGAQFGVFGPLAFALLLWLMTRHSSLPRSQSIMLRCFTLVPIAVMLSQALMARAFANWAAMAYVAGALWLAAELRARERLPWLGWAIAINLVLGAALYHYPTLLQLSGVSIERRIDPYARVRGWESLGEALALRLRAHPYAGVLADDRNLLAQMQFYAAVPQARMRSWLPPGVKASSQYDLDVPLTAEDRGQFLLLSRRPPRPDMLERFAAVEQLEDLRVSPYPGLELSYRVYRLSGFRGYAEAGPPPASADAVRAD